MDSPPSHQQQLAATGQLPPVVRIRSEDAVSTSAEKEDECSKAPHKLDEVEIVRRAMVNTMRLFDANEFKSDPELFKQTVLETLEIVRAQHRAEGEASAPVPFVRLSALLSALLQAWCCHQTTSLSK